MTPPRSTPPVKPVYVLLICLAVAFAMFGGAIVIGVFDISRPAQRSDQP